MREQMGKPTGDITFEEAAAVHVLKMEVEWQQNIPEETQFKDISALQYFTGLEQLEFSNNAVSDLSPLAGMTNLRGLTIAGNPVKDISLLRNFKNLSGLIMYSTRVEDFSPLKDITSLNTLMISWTDFSDLTLLENMKDLSILYIDNTKVSDLTPPFEHDQPESAAAGRQLGDGFFAHQGHLFKSDGKRFRDELTVYLQNEKGVNSFFCF